MALLTVYRSGVASPTEVDGVTPTVAGDTFPNDGKTMLKVVNGTDITNVTIKSQPCSHGRLGDLVYTCAVSKEYLLGPWPVSGFNDPATGLITVTYDQNMGGVKVAAVRNTED